MPRQINEAGIALIKQFEGFSATPYQDQGGVWTQGFGRTSGITPDCPPIDEEGATNWLDEDLENAESAVERLISVSLNDNQFSALCSLVYNVGQAPLTGTVGECLKNSDFDGALASWAEWNHIRIDGEETVSQGLTNRRQAEIALFQQPV